MEVLIERRIAAFGGVVSPLTGLCLLGAVPHHYVVATVFRPYGTFFFPLLPVDPISDGLRPDTGDLVEF